MNFDKRNWTWMRRTAIAALAAIGLAGVGLAQGPGGGFGPGAGPGAGPGGGLGGMLGGMLGTALGLTDAQKTQIQAILDQAKTTNASLVEQLKQAHEQEQAAIKADKSDAELAQLAQSFAPLHTQLHTARLQTEAKIYKVLTPEQRQKLDQIRDQIRDRIRDGFAAGGAGAGFGRGR